MKVSCDRFYRRDEAIDLFIEAGLCSSRNDARRVAKQGGLRIGRKCIPYDQKLHCLMTDSRPYEGSLSEIQIWRGKKRGCIIEVDWGDCPTKVVSREEFLSKVPWPH